MTTIIIRIVAILGMLIGAQYINDILHVRTVLNSYSKIHLIDLVVERVYINENSIYVYDGTTTYKICEQPWLKKEKLEEIEILGGRSKGVISLIADPISILDSADCEVINTLEIDGKSYVDHAKFISELSDRQNFLLFKGGFGIVICLISIMVFFYKISLD